MARKDQYNGIDLESTDTWSTKAEIHEPSRGRRTVVSVPFAPDAFSEVSQAAEGTGEKLSVYIRNAALERAKREVEPRVIGRSDDPHRMGYYSVSGGIVFISGAGGTAIQNDLRPEEVDAGVTVFTGSMTG